MVVYDRVEHSVTINRRNRWEMIKNVVVLKHVLYGRLKDKDWNMNKCDFQTVYTYKYEVVSGFETSYLQIRNWNCTFEY